MAFIESPRFPEDISYGVSFGPEFSTSIASTVSGQEVRNRNRSRALCVGECAHALKTKAQFDNLLKFFRSMGGRFHAFRFKDWSDFSCDATQGALTLISGSNYQMYKVYQAAVGFSESRKITKPVSGTIQIFNGALSDITGTCTIDHTTGIVTIPSGTGPFTWAGEFDVPCRFDTDRMAVNIERYGAYEWGQIPIKEVIL